MTTQDPQKVKGKKEKGKKDLQYRAYGFSLSVVKLLQKNKSKNFTTDVLYKQLLRSGTSVGANIVEGQAAVSRKDFRNFYSIALKSANETKYWLALLRDSRICSKESIAPLLAEATELSKILGSIIIKLKNSK